MKKYIRTVMAATVIFLLTALVFAAVNQPCFTANAQDNVATVIIQPSTGGTTDPEPGTYTYTEGTDIVLTATPDPGFEFLYWVVSGTLTPGHTQGEPPAFIDPETGEPVQGVVPNIRVSEIDSLTFTDNPATVECGYGYTYQYQAIFGVEGGEPVTEDTAIVIIQPSTGGTTDPEPGTHTYPGGTTFTLTAIPDEGYAFHYWVASGNFTPGHGMVQNATVILDPETGEVIGTVPRPTTSDIDTLVFTNNPANIECGFGYVFQYEAVFTPEEETGHSPSPGVTSTPGSPTESPMTGSPITVSPSPDETAPASPTGGIISGIEDWMLIVIVAIVIIIIIAAVAAVMRR